MARRKGFLATMAQIQREAERDRARRDRLVARNQRDAERAAARAEVQDRQRRQQLYVEDRTRQAAEDTAALDNEIAVLENILAATLRVDDFLDLNKLKRAPEFPVFDARAVGSAPRPPSPRDFEVEPPTGIGRVFSGGKHAEMVAQKRSEYNAALEAHRQAEHHHSRRVQEAHLRHQAMVAELDRDHRRKVQEIVALQEGLAHRRPAAVVRYLDLVLEAADYPEGFPHSWSLRYNPRSRQLDIDYQLPLVDVIPVVKAYKYNKSADNISSTARPAAQIRSLYAEVIRQTALRVIHEVFESDRNSLVASVVLNGSIDTVDPATGRQTNRCMVALATTRERFLELDLARVDTAACLEHLEARVSKDPSKLLPVEPIQLTGSLDSGVVSTEDEESDLGSSDGHAGSVAAQAEEIADTSVGILTEMKAGENRLLEVAEVQVVLHTGDVDLAALLVAPNGRVRDDSDFIFYNNPRSSCGSVLVDEARLTLNLDGIAPHHDRVVVVLSSDDGGPLRAPVAASCEAAFQQNFKFSSPNQDLVTAMLWGEFYRRNGQWRFRAIGQGWKDGLAGLARDFGVDVD